MEISSHPMSETAFPAGYNGPLPEDAARVSIRNLNFYYGATHALKNVSIDYADRKTTAMIGPSGCGKSTLLRVLNRMYDLYPGQRAEGEVLMGTDNIIAPGQDLNQLRRRVGMVFQKPTPFPKSIYENVIFGVRLHEKLSKAELDERVEWSLTRAALWGEVKDRLQSSALGLSGGQQQRLCIARALAVDPEVLLLDEPCSALDPISTAKIEDLLFELKNTCTIVIVTHNMLQAARVADYVGFFLNGELVELNRAKQIFQNPDKQQTQDYITGRFG
jgi:phosphate transport system ATP-binding protein